MKKQIFIIIILISGLSYESFAAIGRATDELVFNLVVVGFLLTILGLLNGVDCLKKNGEKLFYKLMTSLKKLITLIKDHCHKIKSNYLDLSYF